MDVQKTGWTHRGSVRAVSEEDARQAITLCLLSLEGCVALGLDPLQATIRLDSGRDVIVLPQVRVQEGSLQLTLEVDAHEIDRLAVAHIHEAILREYPQFINAIACRGVIHA